MREVHERLTHLVAFAEGSDDPVRDGSAQAQGRAEGEYFLALVRHIGGERQGGKHFLAGFDLQHGNILGHAESPEAGYREARLVRKVYGGILCLRSRGSW